MTCRNEWNYYMWFELDDISWLYRTHDGGRGEGAQVAHLTQATLDVVHVDLNMILEDTVGKNKQNHQFFMYWIGNQSSQMSTVYCLTIFFTHVWHNVAATILTKHKFISVTCFLQLEWCWICLTLKAWIDILTYVARNLFKDCDIKINFYVLSFLETDSTSSWKLSSVNTGICVCYMIV